MSDLAARRRRGVGCAAVCEQCTRMHAAVRCRRARFLHPRTPPHTASAAAAASTHSRSSARPHAPDGAAERLNSKAALCRQALARTQHLVVGALHQPLLQLHRRGHVRAHHALQCRRTAGARARAAGERCAADERAACARARQRETANAAAATCAGRRRRARSAWQRHKPPLRRAPLSVWQALSLF